MNNILYQAVFLNEESIQTLLKMQAERLPKIPEHMHCTFKYMPSEREIEDFSAILLGKTVTLKVIGYGYNGTNSGFEVELEPELESVYSNSHTVEEQAIPSIERTTPHITVSMSEDGRAVDTGMLDFKPIEAPFEVTGTGGLFVVDRKKGISEIKYSPLKDTRTNQISSDLSTDIEL